MFAVRKKSMSFRYTLAASILLFAFTLLVSSTASADSKKKKQAAAAAAPKKTGPIDYSNIVWPNPPAIARIRYLAFYSAQKISQVETPKTAKAGWMDRLAGTQTEQDNTKVLFQLMQPYGIAIDSKGQLYVADSRV